MLFNAALPDTVPFVNRELDKNGLKEVVADCYERLGVDDTGEVVDAIKDIGFKYAMISGTTIAIDDIHVPDEKAVILERVNEQVAEVEQQYRRGLITESERYMMTVDLWTEATDEVTDAVAKGWTPIAPGHHGQLWLIQGRPDAHSPAGRYARPDGRPFGAHHVAAYRSNFREGLTSLEYFISTHGARKGLADTALRTADAGYLTAPRRCDAGRHRELGGLRNDSGYLDRSRLLVERRETLGERIYGRYSAARIVDRVG